ncbi:hypothetical protein [Bradyrhizobium prioriisuperbiae]|uniref:hypothetical protein n=1 Tax=Bradyrhizobium prioriisuperbiae TaxID=2854389 RepID=UPI0028E5CF66|nr:hypothetical protein [Bradyrhizobium prioritasuperba]
MSQIEPNIQALGWFSLLWGICCLGFFQLAGMYPLARRTDRGPISTLLVLTNTVLWLALSTATLHFAAGALRWTTIIIMAGLLFLFMPELFQALPRRLRDGRQGLALSACTFALALLLLASNVVGGIAPLI